MEVMGQQEKIKLSDTQLMQQFGEKLNGILSEGYPMHVVLQVLDTAVFEMRMGLYFAQMELAEKQKKTKLQIPTMTIPTNKK